MVLLQALRAALRLMFIAEHRQPDKRGGDRKGRTLGKQGRAFIIYGSPVEVPSI